MITPSPTTPEGQAILDLNEQMSRLKARTGSWPGTNTADVLGQWLARFGFAHFRFPGTKICPASSGPACLGADVQAV